MRRPCIALIPLALALGLAGCSGDDDSGEKAGAGTTTDEVRRARTAPEGRDQAGARREAEEEKQRKRDLESLEDDRGFDRGFEDTPFDRLVDKLPLKEAPLHVQQYITGDGHKVYAAVSRKQFCGLSAARRQRAVESYFESANRTFRRAKVDDLEIAVTPASETLDKLPELATARGDTVTLTRLGRSC